MLAARGRGLLLQPPPVAATQALTATSRRQADSLAAATRAVESRMAKKPQCEDRGAVPAAGPAAVGCGPLACPAGSGTSARSLACGCWSREGRPVRQWRRSITWDPGMAECQPRTIDMVVQRESGWQSSKLVFE